MKLSGRFAVRGNVLPLCVHVSDEEGLPMRCFFHLVHGRETIRDDTGLDVLDLEVAAALARTAINELRDANGGSRDDWSGWRLEIVGVEGRLLHSLDLEPALH